MTLSRIPVLPLALLVLLGLSTAGFSVFTVNPASASSPDPLYKGSMPPAMRRAIPGPSTGPAPGPAINLPGGGVPDTSANYQKPEIATQTVPSVASGQTPDQAPNQTPDQAAANAAVNPSILEPDKVTLDDVRDKLVVTRDEVWLFRDQMLHLDLLTQYNNKQMAINAIQ